MKTNHADVTLSSEIKLLLAIDEWAHAFYLDYQNRRADYVDAMMVRLMN